MKKHIIWVVIAILSHSAWADIGFVRTDDPNLPPCFQQQTWNQSIFRFSLFLNEPTYEFEEEQYKPFLEARSSSSVTERIALDIEKCIQNNAPTCPIYFSKQCTSFFADGYNTFWTNRHCIDDIPVDVEFSFELSSLGISALRFEKLGYDFMIQKKGSVLMSSNIYPEKPAVESRVDFVSFAITNHIDQTKLYRASTLPKMGDRLFIVGFPAPTYARHNKNEQAYDSNGFDLLVAAGVRFDPFEKYEPLHHVVQNTSNSESTPENDNVDMYIDADYQDGMSGSPILNESCQLVGITRGTLCTQMNLTYVPCTKGVSGVSMNWIHSLEMNDTE
ncbi:MAG: hypothetical protein KDD46_07670 [Bdellovibrionales bacterium]|nr:hypothetical protein [Bdellovibrionales bacterium]